MAKWLKKDEKNERIIRELLKLPGNRHCINCNSLGPRYVCTNFWTFVCTTCSGVHREFTHRVKSVSVAKFTSQEVVALQEGGNQHAKDFYLKDWNPQNLPDSSNIEKLRDFIRHVYVERRYIGEKNKKSSSIKIDSQNNGQYDRSQSQIEAVRPKFGLSFQKATSAIIIGSLSKHMTASTTRNVSSNDCNWAKFDSPAPVSQPALHAKRIGPEVSVNGYSKNQDVFTAICPSAPELVPGQYADRTNGEQYPSIVQVKPYQRSKSANPFDMSYDSSPVQSQTFPSMTYWQLSSPPYKAVQPQQYCPWRMPITAQTWSQIPGNMLYLGHEVGGCNTSAFGSLYTSQEPSGKLFVSTTQNSFSTLGGNPFGEL